jgi:hypothetical protein
MVTARLCLKSHTNPKRERGKPWFGPNLARAFWCCALIPSPPRIRANRIPHDELYREFVGERARVRGRPSAPQPPHPSPLPQILRDRQQADGYPFREVFGGEGAKRRNTKTRASGWCETRHLGFGTKTSCPSVRPRRYPVIREAGLRRRLVQNSVSRDERNTVIFQQDQEFSAAMRADTPAQGP